MSKPEQPIITIFCAFSRPTMVDPWLHNLALVEHDPSRTHLAFVLDTKMVKAFETLKKFAKQYSYASIEILHNHDNEPVGSISGRRGRIAFVKNQSKDIIRKHKSQYVIGLEDDTVFEFKCFCRLLEPYSRIEDLGFVEGVQAGRWGCPYVGVWSVDDYEFVQRIESLTLPEQEPRSTVDDKGYEPIDGGGFYYYATPTELYLEHDYSWSGEYWGADVNYGLWLRNKGYKCLVDWQSRCGHRTLDNKILYPTEDTVSVCYYKRDNKWERQDRTPSHDRAS